MALIRNIGILHYMPRHGGGTYQLSETVMYALNDYSKARKNIAVHVFTSQKKSESDAIKLDFPDFRIHRVSSIGWFLGALQRRMFLALPFSVKLIRYIYPLNWVARMNHMELMISPGVTCDVSLYRGRMLFIFTDIAHVFYPHFPELAANGELRRRNVLFKYGVHYADQIVVESEQLRNDTVKYYGADPEKIDILHQTVSQTLIALESMPEDPETVEFRDTLPKQYLFYPAQLWEHKNHKNLLYALKMLTAEYPDLHLILVGSRKLGDEHIFNLINELGISENVKWMGYVPDKFMPVLYKNAFALVKPGYIGPTNIPTLEAFYYGCPAVITDLPGVKEQTADAALLFDPGSAQDIADKIRTLLADKAMRHALVKRGYERLKDLGYESYKNTFVAVLDKWLGKGSES